MRANHALYRYSNRKPKHVNTTSQKMTIDGEQEKVDLPIFNAKIPPTTLVQLTREMINANDNYEVFFNETPQRVYNRFRRFLQNFPRDEWGELVLTNSSRQNNVAHTR